MAREGVCRRGRSFAGDGGRGISAREQENAYRLIFGTEGDEREAVKARASDQVPVRQWFDGRDFEKERFSDGDDISDRALVDGSPLEQLDEARGNTPRKSKAKGLHGLRAIRSAGENVLPQIDRPGLKREEFEEAFDRVLKQSIKVMDAGGRRCGDVQDRELPSTLQDLDRPLEDSFVRR